MILMSKTSEVVLEFIEIALMYKVQLFWEGHKNLRNCPLMVLSKFQNHKDDGAHFLAFSEKLNFTF